MTWEGNPRTTTPRHRANRRLVLDRDGRICWLCGAPNSTIADHKTPLAEGGEDTTANMAPICTPCHNAKSSAEGNRARWRQRTSRKPQPHPGLR